jgi:hypothetical protein
VLGGPRAAAAAASCSAVRAAGDVKPAAPGPPVQPIKQEYVQQGGYSCGVQKRLHSSVRRQQQLNLLTGQYQVSCRVTPCFPLTLLQ